MVRLGPSKYRIEPQIDYDLKHNVFTVVGWWVKNKAVRMDLPLASITQRDFQRNNEEKDQVRCELGFTVP